MKNARALYKRITSAYAHGITLPLTTPFTPRGFCRHLPHAAGYWPFTRHHCCATHSFSSAPFASGFTTTATHCAAAPPHYTLRCAFSTIESDGIALALATAPPPCHAATPRDARCGALVCGRTTPARTAATRFTCRTSPVATAAFWFFPGACRARRYRGAYFTFTREQHFSAASPVLLHPLGILDDACALPVA